MRYFTFQLGEPYDESWLIEARSLAHAFRKLEHVMLGDPTECDHPWDQLKNCLIEEVEDPGDEVAKFDEVRVGVWLVRPMPVRERISG